ncbi:hypothetical protein DFH07DRAFT_782961 [Mycena maculata]|uniref:Uncharacterized protein n=1 Tax=Mycena maculata TaxID=230809 RepID=A0AAD7HRE7_9AGAR|nr:hypothetical protein DFH07DRAFT_782961 [Mycena maculata]
MPAWTPLSQLDCLHRPQLKKDIKVLVTHHVELVLPGAHYLVRMLDGRIDTQGTVKELRAQGVLDDIAHEAAVEVKKEEFIVSAEVSATDADKTDTGETKKPRKLVEDEYRAVGGVKWKIYKTYLKASSYSIWCFLTLVIVIYQLLTVGEKLWIKTWGEAYKDSQNASTLYGTYHSFVASGREIPMDGHPFSAFELHPSITGFLNINWPDASEHPLFYVGIYATIGLTTVFVVVCGSVAQMFGTLRASRTLYKCVFNRGSQSGRFWTIQR